MRLSLKFIVLGLIVLASCNKSSQLPAYSPEFVEHISAYTSGVIDRNPVIRIVLAEPIKTSKREKLDANDLVAFSPKISGEAKWVSDRILEFTPDEQLPRGTIFQGVFYLGKIKSLKRELRKFPFQFQTRKQFLNLNLTGLTVYGDNDPWYRKLMGSVSTNDKDELDLIKQCLKANMAGEPLKIKWHKSGDNLFSFRIDSIKRSEFKKQIVLELNGKKVESASKDTRVVNVPGMGVFSLENVEITNEPDQKVELYFSESLNSIQSLIGLIQLDSTVVESYELKGNTVTLYPKERLVGEHKLFCSADIKNYAGYRLKKDDERNIYFERTKPKLRMVGKGTIVPDAKGVVFPFEAMALKAVDVWIYQIFEKNIPQFLQVNELDGNSQLSRVGKLIYSGKVDLAENKPVKENQWTRYTLNIRDYIKKEPGAIYRIQVGYRSSYTFFECPEGNSDYSIADDGMYYDYYNRENEYLERYTPCDSRFYYSGSIGKNILASDIGLIVKKGADEKTHVFVSSLVTAQPLANTKLEFYTYQNIRIASGYADQLGMADFTLPEEAYMVVATSGRHKGYLKLGSGRNNSTSKFDVDGVNGFSKVDGKLYTERGVWRPGDSIYTCFTLQDKQNNLPANVPVKFELLNPRGQVIRSIVRTTSVGDVYDFRTATSSGSITGNYTARVSVGGSMYYKTLAIETVKPNRLKIKVEVPDSVIQIGKQTQVTLVGKWLHGAPSPGLAYNIKARIRRASTRFKGFETFHFEDHSKRSVNREIILSEGKLDAHGKVSFTPNLHLNKRVPGSLHVDFLTKLFEKGGNFSQDNSTYPVKAFNSYVGIETPKTEEDDNSLVTDKKHKFRIVNVSALGKPRKNKRVSVKIYRVDWNWWWDNHRDIATYMQSNSMFPVVDTILNTSSAGMGSTDFLLPYPNWGRFVMIAKDLESKHTATKMFYVDWPYWKRGNRNQTEQAKTIMLSSNKKVYGVGETVKVTIPSSDLGKALVCVENGSSVIKKFWVNGKKGETQFTFKTTKGMTPNVYVHVSYLQTYKNKDNDLPARLYGILPIKVENKLSHLHPQLVVNDEIRPDRNELVMVKEKSGRPMTYTLAVVDEGLLDLTHFKTPKLWNHFYQKQGLGVRTWDLYDEVMGGYAGKYGNVLSVGGDEEGAVDESVHKANRFKPAVKFLGPFTLKAGQTAKHRIKMGEYIGAVRMMVVARHHDAYGEAEKSVKVKKPIMVLPTLPRVLSPGESIQIPVTVFSITEGKKKVDVKVELSGHLKASGDMSKQVEFAKQGDETVFFKATVAEEVGLAKMVVTARFGNEVARKEIEIAVRTPNPSVTDVQEYVLEKGKTLNINAVLKGLDGTNSAALEVSALPPLNLHSRLDELLQYPHGCVEQTTSSVFAQLFVTDLLTLTEDQQFRVGENIQAAIRRLRRFQTASGGLGYWPGSGNANEWGTNYAGHFLLLAQQQGYPVDKDFMAQWLNYQKEKAKQHETNEWQNDLTQAYRLYTLVLAGEQDLASMNRMRENVKLEGIAKWRLAAAYAMAGMPEVANALIKELDMKTPTYKGHGSTFGSHLRDQAMILETLSLIGDDSKAGFLVKEVAKKLSSTSWLSTQETAYSLISISGFYKKNESGNEMKFNVNYGYGRENIHTAKPIFQRSMVSKSKRQTKKINLANTGSNLLFVRVIKSSVPLQSDTVKMSSNLAMEVQYVDYDGKVLNPSKLVQGQEFKAIVKVKNGTIKGAQYDMALSFMVPVGWEIENTRLTGGSSGYDHQDFRDDRVYTYFNIGSGATRSFELRLTASYAGRFFQPTIKAENMYDNTVTATEPGGWVEVAEQVDSNL
ncbi:MAG: hypothetical protein JJ975_01960 [Bacteroidia bacterium]|nr:hypothetical protein [Bacteroidia bacterium]